MSLYTFRHQRNGKLSSAFAPSALLAARSMTPYIWAFELVDIRGVEKSPPTRIEDCSVDEISRQAFLGAAYAQKIAAENDAISASESRVREGDPAKLRFWAAVNEGRKENGLPELTFGPARDLWEALTKQLNPRF